MSKPMNDFDDDEGDMDEIEDMAPPDDLDLGATYAVGAASGLGNPSNLSNAQRARGSTLNQNFPVGSSSSSAPGAFTKSSSMAKVLGAHGIAGKNIGSQQQGSSVSNRSGLKNQQDGGGNIDPLMFGLGAPGSEHDKSNARWRGPLPQVRSESIATSKEAYQLEQALRYHTVMKPRAETASPPEQSHILAHVLSYFVHNGFSRSAEALYRSGAISQPIAASVRDGPYRDLARMLGSAVSATSELFDDDTPWESELLFRFAQGAGALGMTTSSSNVAGGGGGTNPNASGAGSAASSSSAYPTHDFVILDERSRAQLGTVEFLMTKLVLEHNDTPFAPRQRFDVTFTNVFLTTLFCFCTPDAFVAKCLKLFKAMQLHVSLLGDNCVVNSCRRLLILLSAYVSANRVDVGRTTLERLLSLSVSILTHSTSNPSSGSAEVGQAAQQLLAAIEELERSAATCGAFSDLAGAAQLRKSVANAMSTFGVTPSAIVSTGSIPLLGSSSHSSGGGGGNQNSLFSATSAMNGEPSSRWRAAPFLPFAIPAVDVPRSAFREDGPVYRLSEVPEVEVARQLTLMHFALFQKIAPREFVSGAWMSPTLEPIAANLIRFVRQEELVAQWVASAIIMPHEPSERRSIYARFVRIMRLLFDMQNYSLASSFFQGLENASVRRMTRTVSGSLSDDEQASYDVVKAAMNPFTGSLKSIPQELRTACIPLLAPFVSEACRLHDLQASVVVTTLDMPVRENTIDFDHPEKSSRASHNRSNLLGGAGGGDGADGTNKQTTIRKVPTKVQLVNWSKMISLAKIMLKLASFQSRPYAYDPDSVVQRLLQRLPLMRKDPDRLQQLSLEREPSATTVTAPLVSG